MKRVKSAWVEKAGASNHVEWDTEMMRRSKSEENQNELNWEVVGGDGKSKKQWKELFASKNHIKLSTTQTCSVQNI